MTLRINLNHSYSPSESSSAPKPLLTTDYYSASLAREIDKVKAYIKVDFEGFLSVPREIHEVIASNLPDIMSLSRLSQVNHYFQALYADVVAASQPIVSLTPPLKKFTVPCNFPTGSSPVAIYIGIPSQLYNPIHFQNAWLRQEREGTTIPDDVMVAMQKLANLAFKSNVSFAELCTYALSDNKENEAEAEEKPTVEVIDIQTICQSRKPEIVKEVSKQVQTEYFNVSNDSSTYIPAQYSLGKIFSQGIGVMKGLNNAPQFFQKAARKKELDMARQFYQKAAQAGHPDAQLQLSELPHENSQLKYNYLILAAAQGHSDAQSKLAIDYDTSDNCRQAVQLILQNPEHSTDTVSQNLQGFMLYFLNSENDPETYNKARKLFECASAAHNAAAYYNLARLFERGHGVEIDLSIAKAHTLRSAELGNLYAQKKIALEAYNQKDYNQAAIWFAKASEQGDADAQDWMSILYRDGKGVAKAKQKELYWLKKAAIQGDVEAQSHLAFFYEKEHAYDQALEWYIEAALQDHAASLSSLGISFEKGQGVSKDYLKATLCYKKAIQLGNTNSELSLAYILEKGLHGQIDVPQALKYYQSYEKNGFACYRLARLYEKGIGVSQDKEIAQSCYKKVFDIAQKDTANGNSCYRLGLLHQYGNGGARKSHDLAQKYYQQALAAHYCFFADEIPLRLQELEKNGSYNGSFPFL